MNISDSLFVGQKKYNLQIMDVERTI